MSPRLGDIGRAFAPRAFVLTLAGSALIIRWRWPGVVFAHAGVELLAVSRSWVELFAVGRPWVELLVV